MPTPFTETARSIAQSINNCYAKLSPEGRDALDSVRDAAANNLANAGLCTVDDFNFVANTILPSQRNEA